jgi:hypothetical protein
MADEPNVFEDLDAREAAAKAAASGQGSGDVFSGLPPAGFGSTPPPKEQTWREWLDSDSLSKGAGDFARAASSAATFGMWDRARALPDVVSGEKTYDKAVNDEVAKTNASRKALGPFLSSSADIAGGGATGYGLAKSGVTFLGREVAQPLLRRIGIGAVEGGLYGGAEAAGRTYTGNVPDYVRNAGWGTLFGMGVGGTLPAAGGAASATYRKLADYWSGIPAPVARAGRADAAGLADLHNLGPDAMLPDAGPSMQATAQAAVQGTGGNRSAIVNALTERDKGTVPRLQADVDAAIGPTPRISKIEAGIDAERKRINAEEYAPALAGRVIEPAHANQLIADLNHLGTSRRVDLGELNQHLTLPGTNLPDLSPQSLLNARHRVDSMITSAESALTPDKYRASVLQDARRLIDNQLQVSVPGIKAIDAKHAANTAEQTALDRGKDVLKKGDEAIVPADLIDELMGNTGRVNTRLSQGVRADIDRRVGTQANDLATLKSVLGTEEDYNSQKMKAVFGDQPAADVAASVDRNAKYRETYDRVARGSDTAQRNAAREDAQLAPSKLSQSSLFGTLMKPVEWTLDALRGTGAQQQRDTIAQWMAMRDPAQVLAARDRLLSHNAVVEPRSAAVDKYTRAVGQGALGSVLSPILVDEE